MIPTTTSTPSKSRHRNGGASALWSALTRDEVRDAKRSDEYPNGKTRPRRHGALFTTRANATDFALAIMLLVTLFVTRALIARERFNATGGDLSERRPSVARRVGPADAEEDDLSLARTVRFRNATVGIPNARAEEFLRARGEVCARTWVPDFAAARAEPPVVQGVPDAQLPVPGGV